MLQRVRRVRDSDDGFTLTELLITVIILGVLAAIVVFAVGTFTGQGKAAACKADIKNVEVAVEAYRAKNSTLAADIPALVAAGYLKEPPSSTAYTITYDNTTGAVSGNLVGPPVVAC